MISIPVILIVVFGIFLGYKHSLKTNSLTISELKPTIVLLPTPIQPTQKALAIAAFLVVRLDQNTKIEAKNERGNEKMTDSELIKAVALEYDFDPARMAEKEALMNKIMISENQPVNNNTYETYQSSGPSVDTSQIENKLRSQQSAIDEQQRKMDQLESDARWECISNGGVPMGNKCM